MQADLLYQLLNPLVFLVFALGFFAINKIRADSSAQLVGLSYIVGASAFLADIIFIHSENTFVRTAIAALYAITSILVISGCSVYYRKQTQWRLLGGMLVVHLGLYAALLTLHMDWLRSFAVNFGVGIMFLVGLVHIHRHMTGLFDKLLFGVGVVNCALCFIRPIGIALVAGGELTASTHDETLFVGSLHLIMAVAAIATAMSLFLVLGRDVLDDVQNSSDRDPLTNLLNRRGLQKRAEPLLAASQQEPVCLIVADIDKFKMVNDTYGHGMGDEVIKAIGAMMRDSAPDTALTARLGGEEFLTFLPNTDLIQARQIADSARRIFEASHLRSGSDLIKCTACFGVAQARPGETLDQLTIRADRALYLAKNSGRNCTKCENDIAISKLRKMHVELARHAKSVIAAKRSVSRTPTGS